MICKCKQNQARYEFPFCPLLCFFNQQIIFWSCDLFEICFLKFVISAKNGKFVKDKLLKSFHL
jgi:hypothetical protein